MHPSRILPGRIIRSWCAGLIACAFLVAGATADDRFIVPVGPSGGGSSPPPPSGGGGSGGSSGDSGSSGSGSYPGSGSSSDHGGGRSGDSGSRPGGGRFIVPMPPRTGTGGGGGGNDGGGGSGVGGGGYHDPYWGGCYYWGGRYHYWPGYDPLGYGYSYYRQPVYVVTNSYRDPYVLRGPLVFFPPEPPPLGTPPPEESPRLGHEIAAPAGLSAFITAPFYPQLSTRMHSGNLAPVQLETIDHYRAERAALLDELRARLGATRSLPAAARTHELETLARAQASRLAALAEEAEDLRISLLRGGLIASFGYSGDWNQARRWRLGTPGLDDRKETLGLEFRVVRAAVFYQDGLTPAQRRLLREVAMDLQAETYRPPGATDDERESLIYFSPATTRTRFSPDLPAPFRTKVAAYRQEKDALKAELREVLYRLDAAKPRARIAGLRELARHQEPRLAVLETLADEIRRDLVFLGRPIRPAPQPVTGPDANAADSRTPAILWQRYTDYSDAMFLTGLSSEQRQLLLDGALEQLGLPLPAGERMP